VNGVAQLAEAYVLKKKRDQVWTAAASAISSASKEPLERKQAWKTRDRGGGRNMAISSCGQLQQPARRAKRWLSTT